MKKRKRKIPRRRMIRMSEFIKRGTGLLLIEAVNSNPNGDPDRESDPRVRHDGKGEISPVSVKRKLRDLVSSKDAPVWKELSEELSLKDEHFGILESRATSRDEVRRLSADELLQAYWDVRVFGTTFLESEGTQTETVGSHIKTGVAQFGLGVSLSPVRIERMTTTKVFAVEDDKTRGMAPLGFRVVEYGLYAMPFFINATAAAHTRCTAQDIEVLLKLIPFAYSQTASYIRPQVEIRHAFYVEHSKARGTFSDFRIIEALTPKRLNDGEKEASSWRDYDEAALHESIAELNAALEGRASAVTDLMERV
jgi:Cas7 group CRISPR-associated protein Csh2